MSENTFVDFNSLKPANSAHGPLSSSKPTSLVALVYINQVKADEVEDIGFDVDMLIDSQEGTTIATPNRPSLLRRRKVLRPKIVTPRLPVINRDTTLLYTYNIAYTLDPRVQKEAKAPHRIHSLHCHEAMVDHFEIDNFANRKVMRRDFGRRGRVSIW